MKKCFSIVTFIFFLFQSVTGPVGSVPSGTSGKRNDELLLLKVPAQYGFIKETYSGKSDFTIIHIRDIHCNYHAQQNIAKILDYFYKNYANPKNENKPFPVLVEGAVGKVDTSFFGSFPYGEVKKEVFKKYIRKGLVTGPEYQSIVQYPHHGFNLFGIEDASLYIKNFFAFRNTYTNEDVNDYFDNLNESLATLKEKVFSKELKDFDENASRYKQGEITAGDFLSVLTQHVDFSESRYPNLALFQKVASTEKEINTMLMDDERLSIFTSLEDLMDKDNMSEFVKINLEFRLGRIDDIEYYQYLEDLIARYNMSLEQFPQTANYIAFLKLRSKIDYDGLIDEMESAKKEARKQLMKTEDERKVAAMNRNVELLHELLTLHLTHPDYREFYKRKEYLHPIRLVEDLKILLEEFDIDPPYILESSRHLSLIDNKFSKGEEFYELASKRDHIMVENALRYIIEQKPNVAFVIAGGFHSAGIIEELKKKKISYVVVTPRVGGEITEDVYLSLMLDKRIKERQDSYHHAIAFMSLFNELMSNVSEYLAENLHIRIINAVMDNFIYYSRKNNIDPEEVMNSWFKVHEQKMTSNERWLFRTAKMRVALAEKDKTGLNKRRIRQLIEKNKEIAEWALNYIRKTAPEFIEFSEEYYRYFYRTIQIMRVEEGDLEDWFEKERDIGKRDWEQASDYITGIIYKVEYDNEIVGMIYISPHSIKGEDVTFIDLIEVDSEYRRGGTKKGFSAGLGQLLLAHAYYVNGRKPLACEPINDKKVHKFWSAMGFAHVKGTEKIWKLVQTEKLIADVDMFFRKRELESLDEETEKSVNLLELSLGNVPAVEIPQDVTSNEAKDFLTLLTTYIHPGFTSSDLSEEDLRFILGLITVLYPSPEKARAVQKSIAEDFDKFKTAVYDPVIDRLYGLSDAEAYLRADEDSRGETRADDTDSGFFDGDDYEGPGLIGNWEAKNVRYPSFEDPYLKLDLDGINKNSGQIRENIRIRARQPGTDQRRLIQEKITQELIPKAQMIPIKKKREDALGILNHILNNLDNIWLISDYPDVIGYGDKNLICVNENLFNSDVKWTALFHEAGHSYFSTPGLRYRPTKTFPTVHQYLRGISKTERKGRKVDELKTIEKGLQDELFENMNLRLTDEIRRIRFLYRYWLLTAEEKEHYYAELSINENFEETLDHTARVLLPYPKLLTAVNILLKYLQDNNIDTINRFVFRFYGETTEVKQENDVLVFSFKSPGKMDTDEALRIFQRDLGWDFIPTVRGLGSFGKNYLLMDADDFNAVNVILHRRLAGMGDLVFVVNAGQALKRVFPGKKVRVVFHNDDDFQLVCKTKLIEGIDPNLARQEIEGVEFINASRYRGTAGREAWKESQQYLFDRDDVSVIYALGADEKEVFRDSYEYDRFGGDVKAKVKVVELGYESPFQDPWSVGYGIIGFGNGTVGMAPVSPDVKQLYSRKYPRDSKQIREERKRILKKFPGWEKLDEELGQVDLERTAASEWGFLYTHQSFSIAKYFKILEFARQEAKEKASGNPRMAEFAGDDKTFFVMCSKNDLRVQEKVREIVESNDYNLFVFSDETGELVPERVSKESKITVIMDFSVPRKLFSELFLYSDDLPTIVSGQDNFTNILYMNRLSSGRPFYWETLVFQGTAEVGFRIFVGEKLGRNTSAVLKKLWPYPQDDLSLSSEMFYAPRKWREFFKKIAMTEFDANRTFTPQIYYMILSQLAKQNMLAEQGKQLIERLKEPVSEEEDAASAGTLAKIKPFLTPLLPEEQEYRTFEGRRFVAQRNLKREKRKLPEKRQEKKKCGLCNALANEEKLEYDEQHQVLPQLYPYFNNHAMILSSDHIPQELDREGIEYLVNQVFEFVPEGLRVIYNLVGSTIDHFHLHVFEHDLPVEEAAIENIFTQEGVSFGRITGFPSQALTVESSDPVKMTSFLDELLNHRMLKKDRYDPDSKKTVQEKKYDLFFVPAEDGKIRVYVFLRNERVARVLTRYFGTVEMAGVYISRSEDEYNDADLGEKLDKAYREVSVSEYRAKDTADIFRREFLMKEYYRLRDLEFESSAGGWFIAYLTRAPPIVVKIFNGWNENVTEKYFLQGLRAAEKNLKGLFADTRAVKIDKQGQIRWAELHENPDGMVQEKVINLKDRLEELLSLGTAEAITEAQALVQGMSECSKETLYRGFINIDNQVTFANYGINEKGKVVGFDVSHMRSIRNINYESYLEDVHEAIYEDLQLLEKKYKLVDNPVSRFYLSHSITNIDRAKLPASDQETAARAVPMGDAVFNTMIIPGEKIDDGIFAKKREKPSDEDQAEKGTAEEESGKNHFIDAVLAFVREGRFDVASIIFINQIVNNSENMKELFSVINDTVESDTGLQYPLAEFFITVRNDLKEDEWLKFIKKLQKKVPALVDEIEKMETFNRQLHEFLSVLDQYENVRSIRLDTDQEEVLVEFYEGDPETVYIESGEITEVLTSKKELITADSLKGIETVIRMRRLQERVRETDPFVSENVLSILANQTDPARHTDGPIQLVIDFSLIENDDGNEFRNILDHLGKGVELTIFSEKSEEGMMVFLESNYGLSPSMIAGLGIEFVSHKGVLKDADRIVMDEVMKRKKLRKEDLNRVRFLGDNEKKKEEIYGRYLGSLTKEGLVVLYGDKLNSLAHLITCILTVNDRSGIEEALKSAGFSSRQISEMLPDSGKIPPVPSTRNYLNNIEKYQQSRHLFEIAA